MHFAVLYQNKVYKIFQEFLLHLVVLNDSDWVIMCGCFEGHFDI